MLFKLGPHFGFYFPAGCRLAIQAQKHMHIVHHQRPKVHELFAGSGELTDDGGNWMRSSYPQKGRQEDNVIGSDRERSPSPEIPLRQRFSPRRVRILQSFTERKSL